MTKVIIGNLHTLSSISASLNYDPLEVPRHDPRLVALVEFLHAPTNDLHSDLTIIDVPDGWQYLVTGDPEQCITLKYEGWAAAPIITAPLAGHTIPEMSGKSDDTLMDDALRKIASGELPVWRMIKLVHKTFRDLRSIPSPESRGGKMHTALLDLVNPLTKLNTLPDIARTVLDDTDKIKRGDYVEAAFGAGGELHSVTHAEPPTPKQAADSHFTMYAVLQKIVSCTLVHSEVLKLANDVLAASQGVSSRSDDEAIMYAALCDIVDLARSNTTVAIARKALDDLGSTVSGEPHVVPTREQARRFAKINMSNLYGTINPPAETVITRINGVLGHIVELASDDCGTHPKVRYVATEALRNATPQAPAAGVTPLTDSDRQSILTAALQDIVGLVANVSGCEVILTCAKNALNGCYGQFTTDTPTPTVEVTDTVTKETPTPKDAKMERIIRNMEAVAETDPVEVTKETPTTKETQEQIDYKIMHKALNVIVANTMGPASDKRVHTVARNALDAVK